MTAHKKVALVTGGTRGIGKAIALEFLKNGFKVIITGTSQSSLDLFFEELDETSDNLVGKVCNVSSKEHVLGLSKYMQDLDCLDVLVNNAGVFTPDTFVNGDEALLRELMEVNVFGTYKVSQSMLPFLIKTNRAHIFNICSVAGQKAYPNGCSYSISKFAMDGLGKSMRMELMEKGVRVTNVYPGATLTDSWSGTELPKERFIRAKDVASSIYNAYTINLNSVVEDLVIRPVLGDI